MSVGTVPLEMFHEKLVKNLNAEEWERERALYQGL